MGRRTGSEAICGAQGAADTRLAESPGLVVGPVSRSVMLRHALRAEAVREVGVRATGNEGLEWFPRAGFVSDAFTHRTNRKETLQLDHVAQQLPFMLGEPREPEGHEENHNSA